MKVTNPYGDRAILACIVDDASGTSVWHEIPAGETVDVDDYVVASTLVEHGATAVRAELQAARELWAEQNRAVNSTTASASQSEGAVLGRRQATVDVSTGATTGTVEPLAGASLKAAVAEANAAGAEINPRAKVDEQRDALAAWQAQRGSSTPVDSEFVTRDGVLYTGEDGQPVPVSAVKVDEVGVPLFDADGKPVPVGDPQGSELPTGQPADPSGVEVVRDADGNPVDAQHDAGADQATAQDPQAAPTA